MLSQEKKKIVTLIVDERDIILNADGEMECPLETTLRKNNITIEIIREWAVERIQLIEMTSIIEKTIYEFDIEKTLTLIQG